MRWIFIAALTAGGLMAEDRLIVQNEPPKWVLTRPSPVSYPPLARQARIQGAVWLRMRLFGRFTKNPL